jgi:transcriptional regulator of heat shock response
MITDRQKLILRNVIREYVDSACPVSSQLLQREYDLGLSPATIRAELQELENKGFLSQPHTSAGRVPTDKGYRFFVNELVNYSEERKNDDLFELEKALKNTRDAFKVFRSLAKNIASKTEGLVIGYDQSEDHLYKEGWSRILKEPEFKNPETCVDLAEIVDLLEDDIRSYKGRGEVEIYIGDENPFHKNKNFSLILSNLNTEEDNIVFGIIGPKRMLYDKNIQLVNSLIGLLKKHYDR